MVRRTVFSLSKVCSEAEIKDTHINPSVSPYCWYATLSYASLVFSLSLQWSKVSVTRKVVVRSALDFLTLTSGSLAVGYSRQCQYTHMSDIKDKMF